jgi:hypothetical protein
MERYHDQHGSEGHWNRNEIKKFWTRYKEETHLAEIKPANLTQSIHNQLEDALLDFQPFFQGKQGNEGELIKLELIPNSKPFYSKPFPISKAYEKNTKDEIARLELIGRF